MRRVVKFQGYDVEPPSWDEEQRMLEDAYEAECERSDSRREE